MESSLFLYFRSSAWAFCLMKVFQLSSPSDNCCNRNLALRLPAAFLTHSPPESLCRVCFYWISRFCNKHRGIYGRKSDDTPAVVVVYVIHCPDSVYPHHADWGGDKCSEEGGLSETNQKLIGSSSLPSTDAVWFLSVARQQLWATSRFHHVGSSLCLCDCGGARSDHESQAKQMQPRNPCVF